MTADTPASNRFAVGDHARVATRSQNGNPRTPRYLLGQVGEIVAAHGVVSNPIDHAGLYPPLYTLRFALGSSSDEIWADIHEDWLEPVTDGLDADGDQPHTGNTKG